jgi:RNA polymerase sigma-32 factor
MNLDDSSLVGSDNQEFAESSADMEKMEEEVPLLEAEIVNPKEETALVDIGHESRELVRYDPLRRYLWEIRRHESLAPEEESRLARLYREEHNLDAARQMVTSNLKLVVKVDYLYNKVYSNLMDLIQEGNLGLLQAVKRFDPDRGTRLPTYATWWIKAYIIKFVLDNFRIVRVGTTNDRRKILMNLRREKQRLEAQGIKPTPVKIAEALEVSEEDVLDVERSIESPDFSLDQPLSEDSGTSYLEALPSAEQLIEERLASGELRELIEEKFREFASTLSEKEQIILQERLIAEDPATLQTIADRYGVTREAIRVSEKKLLEKIKQYMKTALKGIGEFEFGLRG